MTQIGHVDLLVADVERSLAFYVGLLGCRVVEDAVVQIPSLALLTDGGTDRLRIVVLHLPGPGIGKTAIELMELQPGAAEVPVRWGSTEKPLPSMWSFSLVVDDLEAFTTMLTSRGVASVTPIDVVELPRAGKCRVAFVRDPDGNLIELIDVPKARPA